VRTGGSVTIWWLSIASGCQANVTIEQSGCRPRHLVRNLLRNAIHERCVGTLYIEQTDFLIDVVRSYPASKEGGGAGNSTKHRLQMPYRDTFRRRELKPMSVTVILEPSYGISNHLLISRHQESDQDT
jgi:hypothetical protein